MPTEMPHRVRKTYTRERNHLRDAAPVVKLVVYIRPDQAAWLAVEEGRRLAQKTRKRGGVPPAIEAPAPAGVGSPAKRNGRSGKYSEMAREALDLLIEYARHAEFMAAKLRPPVAPAAELPVNPRPGEPAARSPESVAPDPQSSGSSGRS